MDTNYCRVPHYWGGCGSNNGGGWKIFGKLIKGVWNKRGVGKQMEWREENTDCEVDISNKNIYS